MKKLISIILVIAVLFGMVVVYAAGTQANPLISQTYAEGAYRASLREFIDEEVRKFEPMAMGSIDILEENVGFDFASGFTRKSLDLRSEVTLIPGSSFTLSSGAASIIFPSGTVVNMSTGNTVGSGSSLMINQRYFCAENTNATVVTSATSAGYVDGYHKIKPSLVTQFVARLYTEALNRRYDENGLQQWVSRIVSGSMTGADVAHGFVFSVEMGNRNLSNADFVEMLYKTMLGRKSDSGGKAHWVGLLDAGNSRESIFNGFVVSQEFNHICKTYGLTQDSDSPASAGVRVFVTRLYTECLGRTPDAYGRYHWIREIQSGRMSGPQVAHGFVFSVELTNRNLSNDAFVEMLYRTMLGRSSEATGKAAWVGRLNAGASRQYVFDGFVDSLEFTELCRVLGVRR